MSPPPQESIQLGVALAAEEGAGVRALQLLMERGHRVVAVYTGSGQKSGSSQAAASVTRTAEALGVSHYPASEVRTPGPARLLRDERVHLLISVHCRYKVHRDLLEVPTIGAYNLHPGPLPECAGLHPQSWALYEGATSHGVTLHSMTSEMDAGPIAFADEFPLHPDDTGLSVLTQCVGRGIPLLARLLDLAERGESIPGQPQELARRRWFGAGPPAGGCLDWSRPARHIVDFVRACDYRPFPSPWGAPRCVARGQVVGVLDARLVRDQPGEGDAPPGTVRDQGRRMLVAAADAWVEVGEVEVAGQERPAADVLLDGERLRRTHDPGSVVS
jgi:UDP-4-amino-4-deoxy-L-arabinose formyltransferase/UDP-glucuronic acid dehydrogenase (UDP-4-keto-hexauronic acid decarboxylating)